MRRNDVGREGDVRSHNIDALVEAGGTIFFVPLSLRARARALNITQYVCTTSRDLRRVHLETGPPLTVTPRFYPRVPLRVP